MSSSAIHMPREALPKALILIAGILSLTPWVGAAGALTMGIVIALVFGNPFAARTKMFSSKLLALSIVGLGAGVDLAVVTKAGLSGIGYTFVSISLTLALGLFLAKLFRLGRGIGILISVGTAICGGSAIAAIFPVIRAKSHEVSVALVVVFMLNAVALVLFPVIGHHFNLGQAQFGLWSALAIHDTSSVVGAGLRYGPQALEVGTTVKLARALWIVPLAFLVSFWMARQDHKSVENEAKPQIRKPWFILGFVAMSAIVSFVPGLKEPGAVIAEIAKHFLVLTLFLIGLGLTRESLRAAGLRPLMHGVLLWAIVASASLLFVMQLPDFSL